MFEKVTPAHPDKIADRVAGAIVDLAYEKEKDPKIAVEVLIGHGVCHIIIETSVILTYNDIASAVHRIAGEKVQVDLKQYPQDKHLAANGEAACALQHRHHGVAAAGVGGDLLVLLEGEDGDAHQLILHQGLADHLARLVVHQVLQQQFFLLGDILIHGDTSCFYASFCRAGVVYSACPR